MQANNNYYIIREGVKRTLELAKFVQSESKLTMKRWYYNIEHEDKDRLIDLKVKAEFAANDLVSALQRYLRRSERDVRRHSEKDESDGSV